MQAERKHLFVCGCARSGTTALWRLLVSHPRIMLGLERYILKTNRGEAMTPELFGRDRFFDLRARESIVDDLAKIAYYAKARARFDTAEYVGDKQPGLYRGYPAIEDNFADATVICIIRNIIDVAASYQKRAENAHGQPWSPERDFARAITDWQTCLAETLALADRPRPRTRLIVVCYEDLFLHDTDLNPLFETLELRVQPPVRTEYAELRRKSPMLEERRADGLTSKQRNQISLTAPFDLYRELHDRRLTLPEIGGG